MATNFNQTGHTLDHTNTTSSTIKSGSVVVKGALVCVAMADIAPGDVGAVAAEGVFELPTASGALTDGQRIDYDVSASKFAALDTPASGDLVGCGIVIGKSPSGESTATIKINVRGADVTA